MRTLPPFDVGQKVRITPLERIEARVVMLELDMAGWTVVCRYFENGDAKTAKLFVDEVEAIDTPQKVPGVSYEWEGAHTLKVSLGPAYFDWLKGKS